MLKIRRNKPAISATAKPVREVRRISLNRTYVPIKIGVIVGYILIALFSASTSMFGMLVGMLMRLAGM
jgi:hypothetical protein